MTREQRIEWAKQRTPEQIEAAAKEREREAAERGEWLANISPDDAHRRASELLKDRGIEAMGPQKTPSHWAVARQAVRDATIDAARKRRTITYGELAVVAHQATGLKLGSLMYATMCMQVNQDSDGCLLSSIIVRRDTDKPGDGFEPFARSQGFDGPLATLQRAVHEHFG